MKLKDKIVLITGASSGIGYELSRQLAAYGCRLILLARREDKLNQLAGEISTSGTEILTLRCDVTKKEDIISAVNEAKNRFGKIDIAVLNSGVSFKSEIESFSSEPARETFDVNVMGMIQCVEVLVPDFIEKNEGMIVGVSSLADGRGFTKSGFYCASKAAATIFLQSLRVELRKYNVKVLTVKPGFVRSPMTDKNEFKMPFLMDVDKAVRIIIKGIEKEKRIIQFPFPTVLGSKILKLLPEAWFDFIAARAR